MKAHNTASMEEVAWKDVSKQVKVIAPDIYEAIEQLEPDPSYKLYKIRYPYGATILGKNGTFHIPNAKGHLVPLTDASLNPKLREELGYNWDGLPMSLVMSGQVDLFVGDNDNQIEIYYPCKSGTMTALRAVLDPSHSYQARHFWRMSAGTRIPYALASISDDASFNRLRKHFNSRLHKPLSQQEHWRLFVELANHETFTPVWFAEILIFPQQWLKSRKIPGWKLFRLALLERAWKASEYSRNIYPINKIWNKFTSEIRNKKFNNLIIALSKYIIEASLGESPLHVLDDGSNVAGPFNELTSIFLDVYQLKKYAPLMMVTSSFDRNNGHAGFVSVQMPNLQINMKNSYRNNKAIADMREIKYVVTQFVHKIENGHINVNDTPFSDLSNIAFDFYHTDEDKFQELLPAISVFDEIALAEKWKKSFTNNFMPYRNPFIRGCVKIAARKKEKA
jgi:hypothetical protein